MVIDLSRGGGTIYSHPKQADHCDSDAKEL